MLDQSSKARGAGRIEMVAASQVVGVRARMAHAVAKVLAPMTLGIILAFGGQLPDHAPGLAPSVAQASVPEFTNVVDHSLIWPVTAGTSWIVCQVYNFFTHGG